jgi:hypothetical protein
MSLWYVLRSFWTIFPRFGMLRIEKSGNPERNGQTKTTFKKLMPRLEDVYKEWVFYLASMSSTTRSFVLRLSKFHFRAFFSTSQYVVIRPLPYSVYIFDWRCVYTNRGFCVAPCRAVSRCVAPCRAVSRCVVLCCAVSHGVALCRTVLRCVARCCAVSRCVVLCRAVSRNVAWPN